MGSALDGANRTCRFGTSSARSRGAGWLHSLRIGGARYRRGIGHRGAQSISCPRDHLASSIREPRRGFFLQFKESAIHDWLAKPAVQKRALGLASGFQLWREEHHGTNRDFPGVPYLLLHSLAHLFITAIALECGYPASSIRERIYAIPDVGFGVLLYTGTSDAVGTLGGLVQVGRRIHESVRNALELGLLCSNDPVCAQHDPSSDHERRFLHGAACHGCLLISETSCEQQNDFLDRALVVRTVQNLSAEFFPEIAAREGSTTLTSAV